MANETDYRRHTIKSMKVGGEWNARAFRRKTAAGDIQIGSTEQEAILAVKASLDAARLEQRASRGPGGIPTAAEYRTAMAAVSMTDEMRAMLNAHLWASDHILTATELAHAGGYDSYTSANSQYGTLARRIAEELEWEPPIVDGTQTWTLALATGADEGEPTERAEWRWKLRPEVVEALQDD
jgi:hypothetical protein